MKKLIVLGIIATMVMGMAVAASAAIDTTWILQMKASYVANGQGSGTVTVGTKPGAVDGIGSEDKTLAPTNGEKAMMFTDLQSRSNTDYRAPLVVGATKTWNLRIWTNEGGAGNILLTGWLATAGDGPILPSTDGDPNILLQLFHGSTLVWTAPINESSTSTNPMFSYTFNYGGGNLTTAGEAFYVVASAIPEAPIPEPGSMVALFSGLVGLVGFGIRRRK